jgi:translocation and assembly module TamB
VGGGAVTAQGGVAYRPDISFDLGMSAKGIRMLYPQGMRESIDANIHLAGTMDDATLGGTVNLADLSFTPAFDLTSFISQFSGGVASPPSMGMAQNISLDLAVRSTNNVNLVSRELSVNGAANLQVRGTAADPVILGRVDLNGGDIILNGDRFVLAGGTIQFVNPSQTEPVMNVSVTTTIQQYNISLRFNGPTDQLSTQYTSDPALPQVDIINLLAFGSTTEASAVASQGTSTTQTGESLVASQLSSEVTSRLSKVAGISQLSISPVLGNSTNPGNGANITIQQRVTGNLFVTFSTNTATSQQVIQGQYRISPKVSLSATRDPNGGVAVDTLIKKSF